MAKKVIKDAKILGRIRRAQKTTARIRETRMPRLSVNRSNNHVRAQIIQSQEATGKPSDVVVAQASTLEKTFKSQATGNKDAAAAVGKLIAERALKAGIKAVAFDRRGFRFHGRVKALADSAKAAGLTI